MHLPDPFVSPDGELQPERRCWPTRSASHCSSCSIPSHRRSGLVFVLHDLFQLPFEEIAPMVGRSPEAARQPRAGHAAV